MSRISDVVISLRSIRTEFLAQLYFQTVLSENLVFSISEHLQFRSSQMAVGGHEQFLA
jgi:hypothetical protein